MTSSESCKQVRTLTRVKQIGILLNKVLDNNWEVVTHDLLLSTRKPYHIQLTLTWPQTPKVSQLPQKLMHPSKITV